MTTEIPVIDIPQFDLPPLPLGVVIPDTVGDLFADEGFERIYVGLIGQKSQLVSKTLSPLTKMPVVGKDEFEFTVEFAGPLDPIAYVTLLEGARETPNPRYKFMPVSPRVRESGIFPSETYVVTLRQQIR